MKLTPKAIEDFCAVLSESCNVGKACKAAGISRYTAYLWRNKYEEFEAAWDQALKVGVSALEDEAHRRAFEGIEKPLTHQGQFTYLYFDDKDADGTPIRTPVLDENGNHKVAAIREYSDTLSIFLLKAHAPDKYRENAHLKLSGSLAIDSMSEAEIRAELAALVASGVVPTAHDDDNDISGLV